MIIIKLAGGLGNQMQQYALYRKLKSLGKEVKLDNIWFKDENQKGLLAPRKLELEFFENLPMEFCTDVERDLFLKKNIFSKNMEKVFAKLGKKLFHDENFFGNKFGKKLNLTFNEHELFHEEIFEFENKYLNGFFLCDKYFEDILPALREDIVFPKHSDSDIEKRNEELIRQMEEHPSASIHIRRGDYITDKENLKLFGNIATDEYYKAAIMYVLKRDPDTKFYIFTNDKAYANVMYPDANRFVIVDGNKGDDSLLDIKLMSHCKYNICANSTFSFWGARLNSRVDKVMIRTFKMRNNQLLDSDTMHKYFGNYVLIDEDGELR